MKALNDVHVLIAGKKADRFADLIVELTKLGATVHTKKCEEVTLQLVTDLKINLIILNHLQADSICAHITALLHGEISLKAIPVFTLIDESAKEIQNALVTGVADYISVTESTESIVQKIEAVLRSDSAFSNSSAIDITPDKADIYATGIRVYVVEDDPLLRNLLSIRLEKSSFPYEFNRDGNGAIESMKLFKPDTIILDLMLPGMSGFDILAQIKQEPDLRDVPVIVFSNKDGSEDRQKAKELGANCFYVKAMTDLSELVEKIEALVLEKNT